jgi:hypothetical protein
MSQEQQQTQQAIHAAIDFFSGFESTPEQAECFGRILSYLYSLTPAQAETIVAEARSER